MANYERNSTDRSTSQSTSTLNNGITLTLSELLQCRFTQATNTQHAHMALGPWLGPFRSRRRGHGLDFDDMRPYLHGDDIRHIDWKATARQNDVYTRLYKEEREQLVTLAVDLTSNMFTGSQQLKSVRAALLSAKLAWHISNAGARCALHVQTDNGAVQLPAANGEQAVIQICAALHTQFNLASKATHSSSNLAQSNASAALSSQLRRLINGGRTLGAVILIGGLDNFDKPCQQQFMQLNRARRTATLHIADPLERNALPTGRYTYQTVDGPCTIHIGKTQQHAIKQHLQAQQQALERFFSDNHMLFLSEDSEDSVLLETLSHSGLIP